jgi:hypothetical protein
VQEHLPQSALELFVFFMLAPYRESSLDFMRLINLGGTHMKMKVAICLIVCTLSVQGQKAPIRPATTEPSAPSSHYQLLSLDFNDQGETAKRIFLLDSQTGKVWRYQPLTVSGDKIVGPEIFIPIETWKPREGVSDYPKNN